MMIFGRISNLKPVKVVVKAKMVKRSMTARIALKPLGGDSNNSSIVFGLFVFN